MQSLQTTLHDLNNAVSSMKQNKKNVEDIKAVKRAGIPQFHFKVQQSNESLKQLVIRERLKRVDNLLLNSNDLDVMWDLLETNSTIGAGQEKVATRPF